MGHGGNLAVTAARQALESSLLFNCYTSNTAPTMFRLALEGNRDFLISFDPESRAAYVKVAQGRVSSTKEKAPGVFIDLGNKGQLLGIEILEPKRIEVSVIQRIARQFKIPSLANLNPHAIPGIYASR